MLFMSKERLTKLKCGFCGKNPIEKKRDKYVCVSCGMLYEEWELWDMLAEKTFEEAEKLLKKKR